MNRQIITSSAEETERLGHSLGALLKKKGVAATVCLYGDLGAGKTTFVKGFALALVFRPRGRQRQFCYRGRV